HPAPRWEGGFGGQDGAVHFGRARFCDFRKHGAVVRIEYLDACAVVRVDEFSVDKEFVENSHG
ncbi:MAG TPA: hypothetical protein VIX12_03215, partial [Candidatus Binataceae bacterium]